jgi:hypothetical protein
VFDQTTWLSHGGEGQILELHFTAFNCVACSAHLRILVKSSSLDD